MSSSSHFRAIASRPAAVFSHERKSSQESHSDREGISLAHRAVRGENESLSRLSESENDTKFILEEQRDQLLSEAKSEVRKQECRADFLDCAIRVLQRQIHSSRMEIDHTNLAPRRELARLHEELAQRERALREPHTKSIHEVEELKRAQEMRIDEFSRHGLRESQATLRDLTLQITGAARKSELYERFCSIPRCRINLQWEIIPRSQPIGSCSKPSIYVEPRLEAAT